MTREAMENTQVRRLIMILAAMTIAAIIVCLPSMVHGAEPALLPATANDAPTKATKYYLNEDGSIEPRMEKAETEIAVLKKKVAVLEEKCKTCSPAPAGLSLTSKPQSFTFRQVCENGVCRFERVPVEASGLCPCDERAAKGGTYGCDCGPGSTCGSPDCIPGRQTAHPVPAGVVPGVTHSWGMTPLGPGWCDTGMASPIPSRPPQSIPAPYHWPFGSPGEHGTGGLGGCSTGSCGSAAMSSDGSCGSCSSGGSQRFRFRGRR